MPIRDEEPEEEESDNQTESDESDDAIDDLPNGENDANGVAVNEAARDLRYLYHKERCMPVCLSKALWCIPTHPSLIHNIWMVPY